MGALEMAIVVYETSLSTLRFRNASQLTSVAPLPCLTGVVALQLVNLAIGT